MTEVLIWFSLNYYLVQFAVLFSTLSINLAIKNRNCDKKEDCTRRLHQWLHNLCEKTQKTSDNNDDEVEENNPGEKIRTSHNAWQINKCSFLYDESHKKL